MRRPGSILAPALRLLLVVDSLDVGGAERHVVGLASSLVNEGYSVTLACSTDGSLAAEAERAGVTVRPVLKRLVKRCVDPHFALKLAELVRRERFDLVHAHMYASSAAAAEATLGVGIPLVLTEHSEGAWRDSQARRLSGQVYQQAKHVIAVSEGIRERLIRQEGLPAEKVSMIPNSLVPGPEPEADPPPGIGPSLREKPLVGMVARLQPEKGPGYFLEAAARVASRLPEVNFLVVGDGPLREALESSTLELGMSERVHFLGFRPDAQALIKLLAVLVVPSLSEGSPLVVLEAMSAGVPVIASTVGGIPQQIRHNCEGILVQPGDVEALSRSIFNLLSNPLKAQKMGEAGRKRLCTQFSHASMIRRTAAVYQAALGGLVPEALGRKGVVSSER